MIPVSRAFAAWCRKTFKPVSMSHSRPPTLNADDPGLGSVATVAVSFLAWIQELVGARTLQLLPSAVAYNDVNPPAFLRVVLERHRTNILTLNARGLDAIGDQRIEGRLCA